MNISCVFHFYNESFMLPAFCQFHKGVFDTVIGIDHHSTDNSRELIKQICPEWTIVDSYNRDFNAATCDQEVMQYEAGLASTWKIALTVTEFVFVTELEETLNRLSRENPGIQAFGGRCYSLVDAEQKNSRPDWRDHHFGAVECGDVKTRWRYFHNQPSGQYTVGRHVTFLSNKNVDDLPMIHWRYAPWPWCKERKLQIAAKVPLSDISQGRGMHHLMKEKEMEADYKTWAGVSKDLLLDPVYSYHYKKRMQDGNSY